MSIIPICPKCGTPAIGVATEVLLHFAKTTPPPDKRWAACVSASCPIAYFASGQTIEISELTQALWYKDARTNVPICYCSQLTRGEIQSAVKNGARTIDDIQSMTKKSRTGHCQRENPLGGCCREAFLREIEKAEKHSEQGGPGYPPQGVGSPDP